MFDNEKINKYIALSWLVAYILLLIILQLILPNQTFARDIIQLNSSIAQEDWLKAEIVLDNLNRNWENHRLVIQAANATTDIDQFVKVISQLKILVKNKDKNALGHVGTLKSSAENITKIFPGP